ncbi:hypothetical protein ACFX1X_025228 [Malus domestica]
MARDPRSIVSWGASRASTPPAAPSRTSRTTTNRYGRPCSSTLAAAVEFSAISLAFRWRKGENKGTSFCRPRFRC